MTPTPVTLELGVIDASNAANIAFGGPDLRTLYITESLSGDILMAKVPVAGKTMYGLS